VAVPDRLCLVVDMKPLVCGYQVGLLALQVWDILFWMVVPLERWSLSVWE